MTEPEQIQYLANIFHVARSDNDVAVLENRVVEDMARDIGAGYLETRKAWDLSTQKDFCVKFPPRLSERIRNLEDMLYLAYCDQGLCDSEKNVIIDYARQIGISQDQINLIRKETKARLPEK